MHAVWQQTPLILKIEGLLVTTMDKSTAALCFYQNSN